MIKSDLYTDEGTLDIHDCSEAVQVVLDVAGSIPVVGDAVQDAAKKTIGNLGDALLKAMPVLVPQMANIPSVLKELEMMQKKAAGTKPKRAVITVKRAKTVSAMKKGKVQDGAKSTSGAFGRQNYIKIKKTKEKSKCVNGKCFTGDTLILTKTGLRPIRQIRIGDDIDSGNDVTKETGFKKVEEVFKTEAHTIYHIRMDGEAELKTTAYHPIFVIDEGWVNAINLKEDMLVETVEGSARITNIEKIRHEEPVEVFNFHVEDWESYFVSEKSVYVHNSKGEHENEHPNGIYEDADYHRRKSPNNKKNNKGKNKRSGKGHKSEPPKDGQKALDNSVPAKSDTSNKRLAREGDKVVVLHQDSPGVFHGFLKDFHSRDFPQEDRNALIEAGIFKVNGK